MNIRFDLTEMKQFCTNAEQAHIDMDEADRELTALFSEGDAVFHAHLNALRHLGGEIDALTAMANALHAEIRQKRNAIPSPKPEKELPSPPSNKQGDPKKSQAQTEEHARKCETIQRENAAIRRENEAREAQKQHLSGLEHQTERILHTLQALHASVKECTLALQNESAHLDDEKNKCTMQMERALRLMSETVMALHITLEKAEELTRIKDRTVISSYESHHAFRIKERKKTAHRTSTLSKSSAADLSDAYLPSPSPITADSPVPSDADTEPNRAAAVPKEKTVLCKVKTREALWRTLEETAPDCGDCVKIPAFYLHSLGGKSLFAEMEARGFSHVEYNGETVGRDGCILWRKTGGTK